MFFGMIKSLQDGWNVTFNPMSKVSVAGTASDGDPMYDSVTSLGPSSQSGTNVLMRRQFSVTPNSPLTYRKRVDQKVFVNNYAALRMGGLKWHGYSYCGDC